MPQHTEDIDDGWVCVNKYRPCTVLVREKKEDVKHKAWFHRWVDYAQVREAIMTGTSSGQLMQTYGIVEYEDGTVHEVYPGQIRFNEPPRMDNPTATEMEGEG